VSLSKNIGFGQMFVQGNSSQQDHFIGCIDFNITSKFDIHGSFLKVVMEKENMMELDLVLNDP
jgi:hypothetical protein